MSPDTYAYLPLINTVWHSHHWSTGPVHGVFRLGGFFGQEDRPDNLEPRVDVGPETGRPYSTAIR